MERRDHHDWGSDAYVEEWVKRQQAADPERAQRFQLMCDLFPFSTDATVTILDIGAGYGPVSKFILDQCANATCIAQDGSEPMLQRARQIMAGYGVRFQAHQSDLFDKNWLPQQFGPFDAAVSVSCLHNLRDFKRISEIYGDIRTHLKPGGVFLNLDLVNAPTLALQQHYGRVAATRRQREEASREDVTAMLRTHRDMDAAEHGIGEQRQGFVSARVAVLDIQGIVRVERASDAGHAGASRRGQHLGLRYVHP